jgi:hypothetical protein
VKTLAAAGRMTVHAADHRVRLKGVRTLGLTTPGALPHALATALCLGGKFIPTPRAATACRIKAATCDFIRATRLGFMFGRGTGRDSFSPKFHVPNPSFQPQRAPPPVESWLETLRTRVALAAEAVNPRPPCNMSAEQRKALTTLCGNRDVIVKPADKNLGLTLMGRLWYDQECLRHLGDTAMYMPVDSVDIPGVQRGSLRIVNGNWEHFSKQETNFLRKRTASSDQVPFFYVIPKLHKDPVVGRPIVASHSWATTPLAIWAAHHLNKVVCESCPTVLQSSHALIGELDNLRSRVAASTRFITADVESLYTNIPIGAAIGAMMRLLTTVGHRKRDALGRVVNYILHNNYLTFNGRFWRQCSGIAMGTPLAPPLANIYMFMLESVVLSSFQASMFFYRRYLDDILVVFFGAEPEATTLQHALSTMAPTIRLKFTTSCFQVDFMDFVIGKRMCHATGRADFFYAVHQKALNKYLYISPFSYHPPHVMRAYIKTELVRYVRHSSTRLDFLVIARRFFARLRERGFGPAFLRRVFDDVTYAQRNARLSRAHADPNAAPLILKLCYEPRAVEADIAGILRRLYEEAPAAFRELFPRVMVCWSTSASIYKRLVRANTSP